MNKIDKDSRVLNRLIQESKDFYKTIVNNMKEGVLVHNGEKILYINKAGIKLLKGKSADDFIGRPVLDIVHRDSKEIAKERIEKFFRQLSFLPYIEEKIVDLKGNAFYAQVSAVKLFLKKVGALSLVIARDISQEKKKTEALEESEVKYKTITENSPDVIMRFDREYRHLYVNKAGEKQTGIPVEKFIGKRHEELGFPKRMCDFWHKAIQKVFDTGEPHLVEFDLQTPTGIINIEWRLFPEFADKKGVSTVLAIARDITSRKKTEDKLRKSEENYRTIFNSTNEGIFIHDTKEGQIVDVNEAACKMYGYQREELLNKDVGQLSLNDRNYSLKQGKNYLRKAVKGAPQTFEWMAKKKDGTIFWVEVSLKFARIGDKDRIIAVVRDIDKRKKMEERLKTIEKMEAIGRLVGGIAHDFNNMLTVINGNAQMLQREIDKKSSLNKKLLNILNSGKRGEKLISKLLAFSRKQIFEPKTISLNKIIEEIKEMLRSLISEDINLKFNLKKNLPLVEADPNQIERILINIIINARDAILENKNIGDKIIEIKTEKFFMDKDFVKAHLGSIEGEYILMTIRDTGIGMSKEIISKIFDPFFTTKEEGKGTGLGLSMVFGIVKQNRGYIDVYSEPGMGTIFKIYWPTTTNIKETRDKKLSETELIGGNETILIVEDSYDIREFSKTFLESIGYKIIEAENGSEGLEIFRELKDEIDLVFTDIIMPEMSGKEFADKIKEINPDIKILYTSGYPNEQFSDTGLITDKISFLKKPYSISELSKKIREILSN